MTPREDEFRPASLFGDQEVALVDLLDRLLAGGVVLVGDLTISLAGVDLVRVSLRALITSIAPVESTAGPLRDVTAVVDRPALEAGDG
ncbi:gas vesicle protein [Actinomycetospora atypica]|uniref:Gas vesicle protein n=1 Tax=Actinomycetospora atypica TaxID=1290095 RepID=A0ABV9YJA1_9PSEU